MVLKKQIFIAAISISFFLNSAIAQDVCSLTAASFEKKIKINRIPGFFFKVHPEGKYLSFIGTDNNFLLDIDSGVEHRLVGRIDPVWTHDGKYLTTPREESEGATKTAIHFYPTDEIMKNSLKDTPEEVSGIDTALMGVYQSVGKAQDGYKVLTDYTGVSVATFKPGDKEKPTQSSPCSNIVIASDLPMLSRDGRFLSVYDLTTQSTHIYNIEKSDDCTLAADLGIATGKVSFNYDSSQITFHVDQFAEFEDGYFSGISHDKVKNVVVVNLSESESGKKLTPLSWALASSHVKPGDGGYYPDFDKNGNIYYLQDVGNNFEFVKTRSDLLEFRPYEENLVRDQVHCTDCSKTNDIYKTVAKMWDDLCSAQKGMSLLKDQALFMAMDPLKCQEMIEKLWTPSLANSSEELKKVCPSKNKANGSDVGAWDNKREKKAQDLIKARCLMCHRTSKEYEVEETITVATSFHNTSEQKIKTKKKLPAFSADEKDPLMITKMMASIAPTADLPMPMGGELDSEEKGIIRDHLYRKLLNLPREVFESVSGPRVVYRFDEEAMTELKGQYENLPEGEKQVFHLRLDCQFAAKNCSAYMAHSQDMAKLLASSVPESERAKFIENELMKAKCEVSYEVTREQCLEWKLKDYRQ